MIYAILDFEGLCINRILWDGESEWQPPEGCTAVADPDNLHPVYVEPEPEPADPLAALTDEQKAAILALLQSQ
jgi:hypothetical protein